MKLNLKAAGDNLAKFGTQMIFAAKKHSPEIALGVAVAAGAIGVIKACKATWQMKSRLTVTKEELETINTRLEQEENEEYTQDQARKDITKVYISTGRDLVIAYGPAALYLTVSVVAMLYSHNALRKRMGTLAASNLALATTFNEYRERVAAKYGKQAENELRYNVQSVTKEVETVAEDGTTVLQKKKVKTPQISETDYAVLIDRKETADWWKRDAQYNQLFLRMREREANCALMANGYLMLSDVYEKYLGMTPPAHAYMVGWIYDPEGETGVGDNYVDFGLNMPINASFMSGDNEHNEVVLDFNVDGPILDTAVKMHKIRP